MEARSTGGVRWAVGVQSAVAVQSAVGVRWAVGVQSAVAVQSAPEVRPGCSRFSGPTGRSMLSATSTTQDGNVAAPVTR